MLKKLVTSAFAGALAAVLAAPVAMACPGHDSTVADKDEKADGAKTADKTKAKKDRRIPVSSALQAVLDARRHDPAGEPLPPAAFVFGDEIGRRRGSIKTAWRLVCRRAGIDGLHFHDLRREAGSRWMDAGVPLATIQRWLGHHNISQTSTYLSASLGNDADDMEAFEQRVGRVTQRVIFSGSDGGEETRTNQPTSEKTQQSAFVHELSSTVQ